MTIECLYPQSPYQCLVCLYEGNDDFKRMNPIDFFDKCITDREKAEKILTNSACRDFSYAIHRITGGWEVFEYGSDIDSDSDSYDKYWFHTVCRVPETNLVFDGKGIRTEKEVISEYQDGSPIYAVDVDPEPYFIADNETIESFVRFLLNRDRIMLPLNEQLKLELAAKVA